MSRYGGDYSPRRPPVERWDPQRFERERGGRQTQTVERDHYEERDSYSNNGYRRRESSVDNYQRRSSGPGRGSFEEDRYYDREERYGPPAPVPRRDPYAGRERGYREEDRDIEYDTYERGPGRSERETYFHEEDRRISGGRGAPRPPRPGQLIRRQSSLDTFDRKPNRSRYGPNRNRSPEIIPMRGPRQISPPRRRERDYEDDITVADYDRYGDQNFHGWKEREIETIRRRRRSSSHDRRERDTFREETTIEERHEEKPYPRKGKTKMSARLVNKRAIIDMGYPFEEEFKPEGQFIILKVALNKDLIDLVLLRSKEYNERERERITYAIEAPPPAPRGEVIERREIIIDKSVDEIPRSVREWDQMSGAINDSKSTVRGGGGKSEYHSDKLSIHESTHHGGGGKSHHGGGHSSHHGGKSSHGRNKSRGRSSSRTEIRISKHSHSRSRSRSSSHDKAIILERKKSKSRRRGHSHARRSSTIIKEEEEGVGESNAMHTGPLALVLPKPDGGGGRGKSRRGSERRGKNEILELEIERDNLRKERRRERRKHRTRKSRRSSSSSNSSSGGSKSEPEILIERRGSHGRTDDYKIKDKKGGESRLVKGMLATLT